MIKILLIFFIPFLLPAFETSVYTEIGKYNKGYIDNRVIKGYKKNSIASNMFTIGGYFKNKLNDKDSVWGMGIAQSQIEYSSKKVGNELIEQPQSIVTVPYIFIGLNKKFWSFEIGVSYYFNMEKFKDRIYIDGKIAQKGGWDLNRFKSHTFMNLKIRIFKKNNFHFEFLMSRDEFSPIDGLLKLNVIYPKNSYIFNTSVSLFMPANNFTESDIILKSNERFDLGVKYVIDNIKLGINLGVLIKNAVGGTESYIKFSNRISAGINLSFNY